MLRTRVQTRTASTGVTLSVSHGLGTTLDAWNIVELSNRGTGVTYQIGAAGANRICVVNSAQTTVTLEVFAFVYQGRLY